MKKKNPEDGGSRLFQNDGIYQIIWPHISENCNLKPYGTHNSLKPFLVFYHCREVHTAKTATSHCLHSSATLNQ